MLRYLIAAFAAALLAAVPARAASPDRPDWWRTAVFYEIYPRSFQDSKGDGVGDLNGITARLDYLKDLGVDAIWITPFYPSPQVDFGYDVSDYLGVDPRFGTLQDFDRMMAEARARGIRVVLDLVLNHTSDQHPWFLESRASRTSPKRDWFVWRDGKGPGAPPNNWLSLFGGSAWTWDPATRQYFYHYFYRQQPDLNWRNPEVAKAMFDVTRWWYERGVAGFRLDAVDAVFEDPALRDNPVLPGRNPFGDPNMENLRNYKLAEEHQLMKELRKVADEYGAVLVGETYSDNAEELRAYFGDGRDELQLPTGHMLAMAPALSAREFRKRIEDTVAAGSWPVWVMGNHDLARAVTRYGDGAHNDAIAKLLAALTLTLRGTPILYYGEELGMVNNDPVRKEDVRDPLARGGWPQAKRRDGARTPMQWTPGPAAGFTTGRPWLPVPATAAARNAESERRDPGSVLNFYRGLTALRKSCPPLREGDYLPLEAGDPNVLAYQRTQGDQAVLVVLNLGGAPARITLDPAAQGWKAQGGRVLLSSGAVTLAEGIPEQVGPYGLVMTALERSSGVVSP